MCRVLFREKSNFLVQFLVWFGAWFLFAFRVQFFLGFILGSRCSLASSSLMAGMLGLACSDWHACGDAWVGMLARTNFWLFQECQFLAVPRKSSATTPHKNKELRTSPHKRWTGNQPQAAAELLDFTGLGGWQLVKQQKVLHNGDLQRTNFTPQLFQNHSQLPNTRQDGCANNKRF